MDAVSAINKHIDVVKLLEHYDFKSIRDDGEYIRCACRLHDGNNPTAFVINKETGLYYCHTNCGGGDIYTIVEKMEGIDFSSSVSWLANFFGVDIDNLEITERKEKHETDLKKFVKLVKGSRKKELKSFEIQEEIKDVTKYRGFKEETLERFELGFVKEVSLEKRNGEKYTLFDRLVFPIIFSGVQVGLSFRKTKSADFPKWSHQPANIETKELLYNYDEAKTRQVIVICEGILDVWAFYEIGVFAVATLGAHITEEQYKLLLLTGADLVFAFDGDEAGRKATQTAIKLFKNKANIFVIDFEEGEDAENIPREVLRTKYETMKRL